MDETTRDGLRLPDVRTILIRTGGYASVVVFAGVIVGFTAVVAGGATVGFGQLGAFGDFVGGLLNPAVALAALLVLVHSVQLQRRELRQIQDHMAQDQFDRRIESLLEVIARVQDDVTKRDNNYTLGYGKGPDVHLSLAHNLAAAFQRTSARFDARQFEQGGKEVPWSEFRQFVDGIDEAALQMDRITRLGRLLVRFLRVVQRAQNDSRLRRAPVDTSIAIDLLRSVMNSAGRVALVGACAIECKSDDDAPRNMAAELDLFPDHADEYAADLVSLPGFGDFVTLSVPPADFKPRSL